jgi:uncharacterized protein with FMN-binding domain
MMKISSRTAVVVLAALFSGAGVLALARGADFPPWATPTRERHHALTNSSQVPATVAKDGAPSLQLAANGKTYRDGSYTGPSVDAYYGYVRVRVDVQGGRIAAIHVLQYPSDNWTSRSINSQALPMLESEVIQAQSVFVYMVSGATLSSNAFLRSAYFALHQAHA